ncbi:MAG: hypothetical protein AAF065_14570 [Verrucomicrobiota bacterium]
MENDKLLEELRTQRKLIQKHLEWIEKKIIELERRDEGSSTLPASLETAEAGPSSVEPSKNSTEETKIESARSEALLENSEEEQVLKAYQPPTGSDVARAKIGCLVLFFLSIALFLFLLFGLPYLLD